MLMKVTGECHCGEVSFTATVDPQKVIICNCEDCQVTSGSAFRTIVMSEPDALEFTRGSPKSYIKTADSGNKRELTFCTTCASPFYSVTVGSDPKIYGIRVGVLKERKSLKPRKQIWCQSAVDWTDSIVNYPTTDQQ